MASTTVTPDLNAVVGEIEVQAPPERVFAALCDPKQLMQWFSGNEDCKSKLWEMEARRGGKWRMESGGPDSKLVVNGVRHFKVGGEITEYDPPRALAYTWIANWHDNPVATTMVRWELTPTANGTRVKVTHSGLATENVARKDYIGGWVGVLDMLKKHFQS